MIPQIGSLQLNSLKTKAYPSKTYKVSENRIEGYVDKVGALKQAIWHRIGTERYAFPVYSKNYGIELEQYIGKSFRYIEAGIEGTLRDCLLQDDRIRDIEIRSIEQTDFNDVLVVFRVFSTAGIIDDLELRLNA